MKVNSPLNILIHTACIPDEANIPSSHDPVAVAAVLHREGIVQDLSFLPADHVTSSIKVDVVTNGLHNDSSELGRTIAATDADGKHVYVPRELSVSAFWQCLNDCLDRAEQVSSMGLPSPEV